MLRDAGNNVLTGRTVTWSSSDVAVATVNASGLVTTLSAGTTTITATSEGKSDGVVLTVSAVPVDSVEARLADSSVTVGATVQASAVLRDASNNVLTGRTVTWSSSDEAIATVSASGVVTTLAAGTVTITATSEGKSDGVVLTVTPVPVETVEASVPSTSLTVAATAQITTVLKDAGGNVLTGRTITYGSSDTNVATVSASGLITAVAAGTATITVTSEGKSTTLSITVTP